MKTDVFTQQLSCLPDAVFTLLYSNPPSPHTMASWCARATRNARLAAPIGVCSYCNLCNSLSPEQGPRLFCRQNRGPRRFLVWAMLGFAAPRRFCREHRAPCWLLGKMLRSTGSRFRSTGAPKMPGNSSNEGHYTPPAVVNT